jgi:phospholipase/carboxylesterase
LTDEAYVYAEQPGARPNAPAFFLFHGTGGDEHQFLALAAQLMPGARLIAPRGDVSEQGALRYFKRLAEGMYDMEDLRRATGKMVTFVRERVAAGQPSTTIGLGYSNGANILASVSFAAPELFDTAILLHPLVPFDPAPQPGLDGRRVLITAGRRDPICPPPATQKLADWYKAQGASVTLFWHEGGHEVRNEELVAVGDYLGAAG